jgi:hypothetical protein
VSVKAWYKNWSNNKKPKEIYSRNKEENHNERHLTNAEAEIKALVTTHQDATQGSVV